MQDHSNLKNLAIGTVIVIIVVFAGYLYLTRETFVIDDPVLVGVENSATPRSLDGSFLSALNSLTRLRFDDSIFSLKAWGTLVDYSRTLAPQPIGRINPFAPLNSSESPQQPQ
jgi:hypothetical protein